MSWLHIITHNIPWFIRTPAIGLLGTECYTNLIYNVQLDEIYCLKFGISKFLSLAIVIGSGIVKIPQIIKIIHSKSARGLSLISFLLDSLGLVIIVSYNFRHDFPRKFPTSNPKRNNNNINNTIITISTSGNTIDDSDLDAGAITRDHISTELTNPRLIITSPINAFDSISIKFEDPTNLNQFPKKIYRSVLEPPSSNRLNQPGTTTTSYQDRPSSSMELNELRKHSSLLLPQLLPQVNLPLLLLLLSI
ncbi:hypothetical protein PSTT_11018 [Puccinia striiformis]|uniref:Uncharacterized protein n=1 Tax=Puccinia striiformis TaxID=27350 RepID=A0A2S4V1Y9_9BASI|nr:hypothetical protein PSTT_11018 [Puccinia striiformis]